MTRRDRKRSVTRGRRESAALIDPRVETRSNPSDADVTKLVLDLLRMIELARQQVRPRDNLIGQRETTEEPIPC
jgi:hypothetical protein